MLDHIKEITESIRHFLFLSKFLIKREHTADPNLQDRMMDVVFNTELELGFKVKREWLIKTNIIDRTSIFGTERF
jgi:hypothetical protein